MPVVSRTVELGLFMQWNVLPRSNPRGGPGRSRSVPGGGRLLFVLGQLPDHFLCGTWRSPARSPPTQAPLPGPLKRWAPRNGLNMRRRNRQCHCFRANPNQSRPPPRAARIRPRLRAPARRRAPQGQLPVTRRACQPRACVHAAEASACASRGRRRARRGEGATPPLPGPVAALVPGRPGNPATLTFSCCHEWPRPVWVGGDS